jgi:vacuolar-type H+-ATPase subunit D/Vma8
MAKKASGGGLTGLSVAELQAELSRRQRGASALTRKREKLLAKLAEVEAQIDALGGMLGGGRRRPKNEMNLVDALAKALDGKTMSVTDVAQAVQRQGYRTTSPSFRTIVNQTLINSGKFKRVGRGQYTLK